MNRYSVAIPLDADPAPPGAAQKAGRAAAFGDRRCNMTEPTDKPKKGAVGRPKTTIADLPKTWQADIISLYREGASDAEVYGYLYDNTRKGFSAETFERLFEEDEEFCGTVKVGRRLSQVWWEKTGRMNLTTVGFQTGLWSMNMKNRFGWTDKVDHQHDAGDGLRKFIGSLLIEIDGKGRSLPTAKGK